MPILPIGDFLAGANRVLFWVRLYKALAGTDIPYEPVVLYRTVQNFGKILDDLTVCVIGPRGLFAVSVRKTSLVSGLGTKLLIDSLLP